MCSSFSRHTGGEENTMDRDFYYRKQADAQQAAISKELATRHLLREAGSNSARTKQVMRFVLRPLPIALAVGILLLFLLFG
jgi:hypothetical protein